jgi:hypothetical protein
MSGLQKNTEVDMSTVNGIGTKFLGFSDEKRGLPK